MQLYYFVFTIIRIYVFAKVFYLMYMTNLYPETYPISILTWWIYFLIFDIWIDTILPNKETNIDIKINRKNKSDEESL